MNERPWKKDAFLPISTNTNIAEMWQTLNEFGRNKHLAGHINIFFMQDDMLPLAEENVETWKDGGCWSTIIKGEDWIESMKSIVLTVFGESVFDESVKGVCVVPVSQTHCIVKIWCTTKETSGKAKKPDLLRNIYSECTMPPAVPRYKAFF